MTTTNKLHYYEAAGRGNQIRLALAAANIEWEDVFASGGYPPTDSQREEWRSIGGNTTTNVPMLQMSNGKVYTQSSAVLRAVARMGGLMPSGEDALYKTDKLIADAEDLRSLAYKSMVGFGATKEQAERFMNVHVPLHLGNLERQLVEGGKDFFVDDVITIADIAVYDAVVNYASNLSANDECLDKFVKLKEWKSRVACNPGIASYLASDKYGCLQKFDKSTLGY